MLTASRSCSITRSACASVAPARPAASLANRNAASTLGMSVGTSYAPSRRNVFIPLSRRRTALCRRSHVWSSCSRPAVRPAAPFRRSILTARGAGVAGSDAQLAAASRASQSSWTRATASSTRSCASLIGEADSRICRRATTSCRSRSTSFRARSASRRARRVASAFATPAPATRATLATLTGSTRSSRCQPIPRLEPTIVARCSPLPEFTQAGVHRPSSSALTVERGRRYPSASQIAAPLTPIAITAV